MYFFFLGLSMGTGLGIRSLMMAFLQVTIIQCSLMFLFDYLIWAWICKVSQYHRVANCR